MDILPRLAFSLFVLGLTCTVSAAPPQSESSPQKTPPAVEKTAPATQKPEPAAKKPQDAAPKTTASADNKTPEKEPDSPPLTEKLFYEVMLADVALQRNDPLLATETFYKVAAETRLPWFAQRAAEAALTARNSELLFKAIALWEKLDPTAERPKRLREQLARLAARPESQATQETQIREQLEAYLRAAEQKNAVGATLLQLNSALNQYRDKKSALDIIRDVTLPYTQQPEAHYAVALATFVAANALRQEPSVNDAEVKQILSDGLKEIDTALSLAPEWSEALQLKVLLLDADDSPLLIPWLETQIDNNPEDKSLWAFMARAYVKAKQYPKARDWFLKIWRDNQAQDALIAAGAISMQMHDDVGAKALVNEVRKSGDALQVTTLLLTYARIAESEKRPDEAIAWYQSIQRSDDGWLGAQLQIVQVLARSGKKAEALDYLKKIPANSRAEKIAVARTEAQFYRDEKQLDQARNVLEKAKTSFADSSDILVDLALTLEQQGEVLNAIEILRQALQLDPDSPMLQNALGYTLVDNDINTEEGAALIEEALDAMPNEGSILDSMGWALFRQNRAENGLEYLQRAMQAQPDPEIAAHMGEVLWALKRYDEARAVWQDNLKRFAPDNTIIFDTMRRHRPEAHQQPRTPQPLVPYKLF
jgi:tetratricopeptide (TPR) repeat protein